MPSAKMPTASIGGGLWLRGDAAASYLRMLDDSGMLPGIKSAGRTFAQQTALWNAFRAGRGNLAARPGTSLHESGLAIDVTRQTPFQRWMVKGGDPLKVRSGERLRAHQYGWFRTVPSEPWHFRYYPAKDRHRAAGLRAKLKALGYRTLKAFQKSAKLTQDGKDGPATWTALLAAKAAATPVLSNVPFRFGHINMQAARFGGLDDDSPARGKFLAEQMKCSVYSLCEVTEKARNAIRGTINGGPSRWRVYPVNYAAVLFDITKWTPAGRESVAFGATTERPAGTGIHGAVRAELVSKVNGQQLDVIAVHVRPADAIGGTAAHVLETKKEDIRAALALRRPGVPTVFAGDFNTKHVYSVVGMPLASSDEGQPIDAVFASGLVVRGHEQIDPGPVSDHPAGLVANLTLPGSAL